MTQTSYLTIPLPAEARKQLLAAVPAQFKRVIAEHVTVEWDITYTPIELKAFIQKPHQITLTGWATDGRVQAATVSVDGAVKRRDGRRFHVTISLSPGAKPFDSNQMLEKTAITPIGPVELSSSAMAKLNPRY
jgi:hypothetical protein